MTPIRLRDARQHHLSLVVPLFNEAENIEPLLESVHLALAGLSLRWEVILVDDGSSDATATVLRRAAERYGPHVRVVEMARNYHQTAAMQAGIDAARGDIIATIDGDLQNDPRDLPAMVDRLIEDDLDLVAGWRRNRQENYWIRILPSRAANALIGWATGIRLRDYGCSLKVFRADVLHGVRLYGEMHRFIPAWIATVTTPRRIGQMEVADHRRVHGHSHYGLSRAYRVLLDLVFVWFFLRYRTRPGHLFGGLGLLSTSVAFLILGYLLVLKVGLGQSIGSRPLLLVGIVLLIAGIQAILLGLIAEFLTRIYYESGRSRPFVTHRSAAIGQYQGWHRAGNGSVKVSAP